MSYNKYNNNVLNKELLNKLLNNSNRRYLVRSFSVGQEDLPTFALFLELVQREKPRGRGAFSKLVVKAIREYVRRHHPGNPQLPLTKFTMHVAKTPKPAMNPEKEKARRMLTAVLKHVQKGYDLNPKAHEYYVQLAHENSELEEAAELLTLLSHKELKHQN